MTTELEKNKSLLNFGLPETKNLPSTEIAVNMFSEITFIWFHGYFFIKLHTFINFLHIFSLVLHDHDYSFLYGIYCHKAGANLAIGGCENRGDHHTRKSDPVH